MKPFFKRRITEKAGAVTFTAPQVASVYGFPAGNGSGQGIGLIELGGGYEQADLVTYFGGLGLPVPDVVAVSVDGATNAPTGDPDGPDGEVALDIQIAGAIAPSALIKVFFAPNTNQGFLDAINAALADPEVNIVSISWGGPENTWGGASVLSQFDSAFAAGGKLVFVASGDSGSGDGESGKNVDFPASSPHVVGCGATTLIANAALTAIVSEVVWNSDGGSSGGGVSSFFPLPSYQAGANVPGGTYRGVPDVASNGDPNTGYEVVVDGSPEVYGGTSCCAPLYAGLFARINSILVAAGEAAVAAPANAQLYILGLPAATETAFNEIVSGNNGVYVASAGWNACCGLGSPKGSNLLSGIEGSTPAPTPTPVPTPTPTPVPTPTSTTYYTWLNELAAWIASNPATIDSAAASVKRTRRRSADGR
jgi:kumamolisin